MEGGRSRWAGLHLLDRQVIDADNVATTKVDDLDFDTSGDLPVLTHILCGQAALARRFSPRLARLLELLRRVIDVVEEPGPSRIPWSVVKEVDSDVRLSVSRHDLAVTAAEEWLSEHAIGRIPGSESES